MDRLQLSADARALLQEGISVVLSRWASLQLVIENERGGRNSSEKALKLASDIFIWFTQTKGELYIDDLENLLDKAMLSLNTKVADGSIEKVSYELMSVHEECLGGNRMDELQLSPDAKALFQEGISMVLSRWSSLQLAIENEWGGRNSREKALKLASDIFIWFTQTKGELYIDDLENLLDEAMLSLNTEVDDGSIEEVSYELMSMHEECLGGNYDIIQRLRASTSQARPVQHVRQMESDDEEDDDDDGDGDMMVDVPETKTYQIPMETAINQPNTSNAAPAEDGWVVVSSKKNKGRRN